jgi:hypothetical protein
MDKNTLKKHVAKKIKKVSNQIHHLQEEIQRQLGGGSAELSIESTIARLDEQVHKQKRWFNHWRELNTNPSTALRDSNQVEGGAGTTDFVVIVTGIGDIYIRNSWLTDPNGPRQYVEKQIKAGFTDTVTINYKYYDPIEYFDANLQAELFATNNEVEVFNENLNCEKLQDIINKYPTRHLLIDFSHEVLRYPDDETDNGLMVNVDNDEYKRLNGVNGVYMGYLDKGFSWNNDLLHRYLGSVPLFWFSDGKFLSFRDRLRNLQIEYTKKYPHRWYEEYSKKIKIAVYQGVSVLQPPLDNDKTKLTRQKLLLICDGLTANIDYLVVGLLDMEVSSGDFRERIVKLQNRLLKQLEDINNKP